MSKSKSKSSRNFKSPATPEKGYKLIKDLRFKRLLLYTSPKNPNLKWWVIESKLYANIPVKNVIKISLDGIYWEQGIADSEPQEIRSYYPVNQTSEQKALQMLERDNNDLEKEYKKLGKFRRVKG